MKRIANIFDDAISYASLWRAFDAIRRDNNKKHRRKIRAFEKHIYENLMALHNALADGTWHMHPYKHTTRLEGHKLRDIWYSSDFGDMIVQRALCMTIGVVLNKSLITDTYAGIPGKSMHKAMRKIWRRIQAIPKHMRIWVYKCDIYHFYMSIDHHILKILLALKIKDKRMLALLYGIIDSSPFDVGLPIGNMLSTVFANFYLNYVDRMAQCYKAIYCRYNDDIVAVKPDKDRLRDFRTAIHLWADDLALTIKPSERLYPLDDGGLDFVGYIIRSDRILVRRRTERKLRKRAAEFKKHPSIHRADGVSSYWGWCKRSVCGRSLWKKLLGVTIKRFHRMVVRLCT